MLIALQILGGISLLFIGGEILIRGAVALSRHFGLSPLSIGLTVVAYGTSMPELIVSVKASVDGFPGLVLGNAVGSNISNILLILGAAAIIYPLKSEKRLVNLDLVFSFALTILLFLLVFTGQLSLLAAIILIVCIVTYTFMTFRSARADKSVIPLHQTEEIEEQIDVKLTMSLAIIVCIVGILLLAFGAEFFVDGSVAAARLIGISETTIGLTLVAFGTSAPELATSIVAAFRRHSDIALGNVVGSNIFNIAGILGISSLIAPISIDPKIMFYDIPILLISTILLLILLKQSYTLSRRAGVCFCIMYVGYIGSQAYFQ
jgi:cation:H+ antiporter